VREALDLRADVRLLIDRFDPPIELSVFTSANPAAGGIVSFVGQVRADAGAEAVEALELRHYAPLTLPAMQDLATRTLERFALEALLVVHRSGEMAPGDPIVMVAAAARHRRDAFAAAEFAMDHLKSESWFWKREKVAGQWRWIEPRPQDHEDLSRWT
jgi:molybdopterin synthase catalytic subunit